MARIKDNQTLVLDVPSEVFNQIKQAALEELDPNQRGGIALGIEIGEIDVRARQQRGPRTARFGKDGITIVDPNRSDKVFQNIYTKPI